MATRATSLRALIVLGVAVVLLLVTADLVRSDSVLRSAWHRLTGRPAETPAERVIHDFTKERGLPDPLKR